MDTHSHPFARILPGITIAGILLLQSLLCGAITATIAYAETPRFELDAVVVTASREETTVGDIARNITVITAEDIEQATSSHMVDLLAREAGVTLQSLNGSDKNASVDIRGMGATAANNIIVLVDGVRQNSADLSGTDFSSIALDQIERIEIMRGSGAVLYGDGAVGGVINIITKTPSGPPKKELIFSYGSYATLEARASLRTQVNDIGIKLNTSYHDSDGFRDNGFLTKYDVAAKLDYAIGDHTTIWLNGAHHYDEYGLPGPVPLADINSKDARSATSTPNDEGETTDQRIGAGFRTQGKKWGTLTGSVSYRFRDNPYLIGYSPLLSRDEQTSEIAEDSRSVDLRYHKGYTLFERSHQIQLGLDHFSSRYVREELPGGPRENSATDQLGVYITNHWQLTQALNASAGYRRNRVDGTFRTDTYETFGSVRRWVNGIETDKQWDNSAFDLGLTYQLNPNVTFFTSYATSFRAPNVDELAEAEDGLEPQTGDHFDAGAKFYLGESVEWSATLFQIRIDDELFYSETNRNYDEPTLRRGVETDIKWYPTPRHYIWANYTYTYARFEDSDLKVPLVPEHKANAGWEWQTAKALKLALSATYVGERFDGNDLDNTSFEKVRAYTVVDLKISWVRQGLKLFVGINNLLDEYYVTTGYSQTYYTMPERNFYGGLEWRF